MAPPYMNDMYTRNTRHSDNKFKLYMAPRNNLKVFTDSFQYSNIWNQLPPNVMTLCEDHV